MDEYIPQLTLTPDLNAQPQPEVKQEADLITKAQAAPEAGPDLSALSEQEQQAVLSFSNRREAIASKSGTTTNIDGRICAAALPGTGKESSVCTR